MPENARMEQAGFIAICARRDKIQTIIRNQGEQQAQCAYLLPELPAALGDGWSKS